MHHKVPGISMNIIWQEAVSKPNVENTGSVPLFSHMKLAGCKKLLWLLQNPKTLNEPLDQILGLFRHGMKKAFDGPFSEIYLKKRTRRLHTYGKRKNLYLNVADTEQGCTVQDMVSIYSAAGGFQMSGIFWRQNINFCIGGRTEARMRKSVGPVGGQ